jgi:glycosyltransferase 2 family protein
MWQADELLGGPFAQRCGTDARVLPARRPAGGMTGSFWKWARPVGGAAIIAFLLWRLGTGPFLHGVRMINGWALAGALGLGAVTTVCCAWRWSLVARGLGVRLPLGPAVAQCYRSVFLNATLPGGVLGDVHRAVRHGQDVGDVSRGIRAVVWERTAGQLVQTVLAVVLLFVLPSPVRPYMPIVAAVAAAAAVAALLVARTLGSRLARALRTARADVRDALLARHIWPGVVLTSAACVLCHLAMFVVSARTAGATASLSTLVPLALLALLAMSVPLNVGGWGAREGVAAWAFGAAGLTVTQGVATAVVYGALVLVSSLPGAGVLLFPWLSRMWRVPAPVPQES